MVKAIPQSPGFFTADQANGMLPLVRRIVADWVELNATVESQQAQLEGLKTLHQTVGVRAYSEEVAEVEQSLQAERDRLVECYNELESLGLEPHAEEIGSVDYDVWATDEAEELMILRYKKRFTKYKGCPNCSYIAYYHAFSKTVKHPTYSSTGRKKVVHRCKNCNYEDLSYRTIPKKTRSSSSGGGSGGGSSSFGGGSSGGGGAGVSW